MVTEKTGKISGLDYVDKVVDMVNNHPNIAKKDRWKVTIALLEPMLEKVFGHEYEPYEGVDSDE